MTSLHALLSRTYRCTMIAGLSKAINLYLAPLLSLTSFILILFSYLAPIILFPTQVALLKVSPSLELTQSKSSDGIDGPSIFLGALGMSLTHRLRLCTHIILQARAHAQARMRLSPARLQQSPLSTVRSISFSVCRRGLIHLQISLSCEATPPICCLRRQPQHPCLSPSPSY